MNITRFLLQVTGPPVEISLAVVPPYCAYRALGPEGGEDLIPEKTVGPTLWTHLLQLPAGWPRSSVLCPCSVKLAPDVLDGWV